MKINICGDAIQERSEHRKSDLESPLSRVYG
jgi:hypothetical protein